MSQRAVLIVWIGCVACVASSIRVAKAQVGFAPVVGAFNNGVNLDVTPVVSHDRRYVRMSLNFQSTAIEGFDAVSIPAAVGGTGNGAGGGFGGGLGAGGGRGAGAGGGGGRFGFLVRPPAKNPWGNNPAPIAIAKGPALSLDFPDEVAPANVATVAPRPRPKGTTLALQTKPSRTRSKTAKSRKN